MKYIAIIVLALIGLKICTIVENVMWECDRDKALGCSIAERRTYEQTN